MKDFNFLGRHVVYQTNLKNWAWFWWAKPELDTDYNVWSHFAGFGPWQFHWYGERNW
jgi:hypothetical protein